MQHPNVIIPKKAAEDRILKVARIEKSAEANTDLQYFVAIAAPRAGGDFKITKFIKLHPRRRSQADCYLK